MKKVNANNWKYYKLGIIMDRNGIQKGDGLFNIFNYIAYHNKAVKEVSWDNSDGVINYVTRSKFNNGVKCKVVKEKNFIVNPANTISFGAENGDFFYQPEEYITGNKMYYIDTTELNPYAALFVKTILQTTFTMHYSFSDGMIPSRIYNKTIRLPSLKSGKPDWGYMMEYMKIIEEKAQKRLKELINLV